MSEQGWRQFLEAEGVDDWVVLHGGATAVFRTASLVESARLAEAVASVPGVDAAGAVLTVTSTGLSVRLTRDMWRLEDTHIDLARAVLGYEAASDDNGTDPLGHGSTVWMQELNEEKPLRHAMHVDVSLAREQATVRLEAALAAGGRIVNDSPAPGAWILSDPAGNRVCIASWPDGAELGDAPA